MFIFTTISAINFMQCVCPAWAEHVPQGTLVLWNYPEGASPLCTGLTSRSISKSQARLPWGIEWRKQIFSKRPEGRKYSRKTKKGKYRKYK